MDDLHDLQEMGPVDYLCIEFPPAANSARVCRTSSTSWTVASSACSTCGSSARTPTARSNELIGEQLDSGLALFQGASSGMLGGDDLEQAASVLEPGSAAALIVYENVWAGPFAGAVRRAGGRVIAGGRIPVQSLLAALDESEPDYVRS